MITFNTEFWQGVVDITQVPDNTNEENGASWLCNPFKDDTIYTVQILLDFNENENKFSWRFLLKEDSERVANLKAQYLLNFLREKFPGLTGKVCTKGINCSDFYNKVEFNEIVFPEPPYVKKFNLFKRIIGIFFFLKNLVNQKISFYIIWEQDDSVYSSNIKDEDYKVKIFFKSELNTQSSQIKQYVNYLLSDFENTEGDRAILKRAPSDTWKNILNEMVFFRNIGGNHTGRRYKDLKRLEWMPEWMPGFIKPEEIDFIIPSKIPIKKAVGLHYERTALNSTIESDEIKLFLGNYIDKYGVKTEQPKYLDLNDLNKHMGILGLTGSGRTRFICHIINEIAEKAPKTGILVLLLRKGHEKSLYNCEKFYEYPNLKIPYYFFNDKMERGLEDLAKILTSNVGLKDIYDTNMFNAAKAYIEKRRKPPNYLRGLLQLWWGWFKKRKYPGDFGGTSLLAIENRVYKLLDSEFATVTKLGYGMPTWFKEFISGKNILIDLSPCNKNSYQLKLLIHFIFQTIKLFLPDSVDDKLKYAVIIDEIEHIAKIRNTNDYGDNLSVIQNYLEQAFSEFLEAFRSRGVGLITVGKDASVLFKSIYTLPNINILFNIKLNEAKYFTNCLDDQMALANLGFRQACIINSVRQERFLFYTPTFDGC